MSSKQTEMSKRQIENENDNNHNDHQINSNNKLKSSNNKELKLSKSLFNFEPIEYNLKTISDFIFMHLDKPNLEIEAKLGIIIDKETRQRIRFPTMSEVVLTKDFNHRIRFESNMTEHQHRHFNQLLNFQVEQSRNPNYHGAPITYEHLRQIDSFYSAERGRVRVTSDQKTKQIIPDGIITKTRIADLNIHSPNTRLDFRISLNSETPVKEKPQGTPQSNRYKDRLSYTHELFKVDLTQVKTQDVPNNQAKDLMHELEIEFLDTNQLIYQKELNQKNLPNQYLNCIQIFLNNIRILSQKSI